MATIEPRLIHLLNESTTTPRPHHAELPPFKALPLPPYSSWPYQHEHGGGQRPDAADGSGGPPASQSVPSLCSVADEPPTNAAARAEHAEAAAAAAAADRTVLNRVSSQDLRMILDGAPPHGLEDSSTKKRPVKEDYPQLPQPLKKQKATAQQHMFPPIIVGLLEPPLDPALFPPISSASFDDRPRSEPPQALSITKPPPELQPAAPDDVIVDASAPPPADAEPAATARVKRRAAKPRRKWSEEETNHLLLGASKHGVGRWTDILEDPGYKFNGRTAGDLKDRFRTCCPEELRGSAAAKGQANKENRAATRAGKKPKKGLMSENILNETEEEVDAAEKAPSPQNDYSDFAAAAVPPRPRKSRAHRKKLEDLAELGIQGPFRKSHRRERRPFSEQDDREILEGFEAYGPQWTKIQRDPRFNLASRQPTDLRDRLRNKYPERFVTAEKTAVDVRDSAAAATAAGGGPRGNSLLEPSVTMAIENTLTGSRSTMLLEPPPQQQPNNNRAATNNNSREDNSSHNTNNINNSHKWPLSSSRNTNSSNNEVAAEQQPPQPQSQWHSSGGLSWTGENAASGACFPSGEMDISRLLLDDTQQAVNSEQQSSSEKRGLG
ncbi:hypothetical protein GGR56DRAFT_434959 [Xylariaceae sp. FL0804]|nr:hypothetical protein GGR56DRAFT_434959 [Xylariaceae sp. FL0804]